MSFVQILSSLLQLALVTGLAFVVIVAIASYLRFHHLAHEASKATPEDENAEGAFQIQIAERLGTGHRHQDPFSVVLLGVCGCKALQAEHGAAGYAEIRRFAMEQVRLNVRAEDHTLWVGEDRLGLLLTTEPALVAAICERLMIQVPEPPCRLSGGSPVRLQICAGVSSFPAQGERVGELVSAAVESLETSLTVGPGTVTFVDGTPPPIDPVQATPDDPLAGVSEDQRDLVDPLTGFLLEKHLGGMLQKRVAQARRDEEPVSIVSFQIDHLDRYQDHYGTPGVEAIQRHMGSLLQTEVREGDLLARYDEEPLILILGCGPEEAFATAQRLSDAMKKSEIVFGNTELKITVSGGVAGYPDHGGIPKKLLEFALLALELAKAKGRNQVLYYESGMKLPRKAGAPADSF